MLTKIKTLTYAAVTMLGAVYAGFDMDQGVLVLNDQNFDTAIEEYELLMVEFYAPWCGHCQELAPLYAKAAGELSKLEPKQYLAKVDATENPEVSERYGIEGFPTLLWFTNGGEPQLYVGGRTDEAIVEFVKKMSGPPTLEAADCSIMDKYIEENKLALGYFGDFSGEVWEAYSELPKFESLKMSYDFFYTQDPACGTKYGVKDGGLMIHRTFDEEIVVYTGEPTLSAISQWAHAESIPTLINFNEDHIPFLFRDLMPALVLFVDNLPIQDYMTRYAEAAKELKGEILFVLLVKTEDPDSIQQELAEFLDIDTSKDAPTLRLLDAANQDFFGYDGDVKEIDTEKISSMIKAWKNGELTSIVGDFDGEDEEESEFKSEPIPESNDGPLTTFVGDNLLNYLHDDSKDIFIKFYHPECSYSQEIEVAWYMLAEAVSDITDLIIAEYNVLLNEIPGFEIEQTPTITLYKKGRNEEGKQGHAYPPDAPRTIADWLHFLSENSQAFKDARPTSYMKQEEL